MDAHPPRDRDRVRLVLLLVSGGKILWTVVGLAAVLGLPSLYLGVKESRRTAAFLAQLPDTLQLLAGSLSAGYSLPQAVDTVVREGHDPIAGEFNRALVEARLGVPIEDALEGVADRMGSKDFAWVVMAIRIQREVGGNLAELLADGGRHAARARDGSAARCRCCRPRAGSPPGSSVPARRLRAVPAARAARPTSSRSSRAARAG